MNARQPVLFVSHGAPDLLLNPGATGDIWTRLGRNLPKPTAILAVSAHWESTQPEVGAAPWPDTVHDFGGFPRQLYQLRYPAPGAIDLASRLEALLDAAGLAVRVDHQRGLDHGAWVPLTFMHPDADIPVTQLSIQPQSGPAWHLRLGALLRPLRDEGVLVLASGAVTHNFGWLGKPDSPAYPPASEFAYWLSQALAGRRYADLLDYRNQAPHGAEAHPSDEHLLPLFVALGATHDEDRIERLSSGYTYGGLAMDTYLWQVEDQVKQNIAALRDGQRF